MLAIAGLILTKKPAIFFQRAFHGRSTWGALLLKSRPPYIFLFATDYRTTTPGRQVATVFQEVWPGAGFKKSWGGGLRSTTRPGRALFFACNVYFSTTRAPRYPKSCREKKKRHLYIFSVHIRMLLEFSFFLFARYRNQRLCGPQKNILLEVHI